MVLFNMALDLRSKIFYIFLPKESTTACCVFAYLGNCHCLCLFSEIKKTLILVEVNIFTCNKLFCQ